MGNLKVGLVQQSCSSAWEANLEISMQGIRDAVRQGAQLVVLQELHNNLYFCQAEDPRYFAQAESIPGVTTETLGRLAAELKVVIIASLFEHRAPGLYHNTAVVLDMTGQITGRYRKMHLPDDPGYHEKFYFTPGDLGFSPIPSSVGKLGVLLCWDQWYPEAARLMALRGAELLVYPTAIGWAPNEGHQEQVRQLDAWVTVQRAHAVTNSLPLIACNRVGWEDLPEHPGTGLYFWGTSFIVGPQGEKLAEACDRAPSVLVAEVDLQRTEDIRRHWPFLRDRRIDAYQDIVKRYLD